MIADSLNILVAVRDGASVSGTNFSGGSARADSAASTFGILRRVGEVHGRVLIKGGFRFVMFFFVSVYFRVPFAFHEMDW